MTKLQQQAKAAIRDLFREEFEELRETRTYPMALRMLRDRHWEAYEVELKRLSRSPMVPAGRALCAECSTPLLAHKIGQCRPQVYSWL